jgi:WD40 repeat protein
VKVGGVSCVQLESIGPFEFDPDQNEDDSTNRFAVATYQIKGDTLEFSLLSDDVVSGEITTSADLRKTFLENITNKELFEDPQKLRDTGQHEEDRLALEPTVAISDDALTRTAHANPVSPEIAVITTNGNIRIYNFDGQITQTLKRQGQRIRAISYSADGRRLLAGTKEGDLLVWNISSGDCTVVAGQVADSISRVAWLDGTHKVVWKFKAAGGVVERTSGQIFWTYRSTIRDGFQTLSTSPGGPQLAVLDLPGEPKGVYILDGVTGLICASLINGSGPLSTCVGPDGKTVAVGYAPRASVYGMRKRAKS